MRPYLVDFEVPSGNSVAIQLEKELRELQMVIAEFTYKHGTFTTQFICQGCQIERPPSQSTDTWNRLIKETELSTAAILISVNNCTCYKIFENAGFCDRAFSESIARN